MYLTKFNYGTAAGNLLGIYWSCFTVIWYSFQDYWPNVCVVMACVCGSAIMKLNYEL